ncbi:helix-turn-helix domain-containing protein [Thermoflexus sp.]|uniref:AlbA family DNA-binding domain-containing protein n=1 Tax=Thermoflexus sp. TaxID=1969742 RepID=UPI002ADD6AF3|nr:RNA-binding domain-containing protein [Thermoflexus sp.]
MNPGFIKRLIAQGEGPTVEFKREADLSTREGQAEFCKDLMSLANIMKSVGRTSYLLIGVDDDGSIVGMKEPLSHRQLKDAADLYCQPPIVFRYWQGLVDGKLVGLITIPQSYRKPHKFKREFSSDKKRIAEHTVFTRHLSHVVIASPEEIVALDQEAALERRRRARLLTMAAVLAVALLIPLLIVSGVAYARPIQEFATLIFPQGFPLLPSGYDPSLAPLRVEQVDRMLTEMATGPQPFKAVYQSRIVASFDPNEYVSNITLEYRDPKNWKATVKANYGQVAYYGGGELICAVRDGVYYEIDPLSKRYAPSDYIRYRNPFKAINEADGIRAPFDHLETVLNSITVGMREQYKPWRKMVRISGRLARVYERQAGVDAFHFGSELHGSSVEKVYVDVERNIVLRYEAMANLKGKVKGKEESAQYEIGFEVISYGNPVEIDWSFIKD